MPRRQFNIRFVETPLQERPIDPLCRRVQDEDNLRRLSITDEGFEILATLVGRKMSPSLRRVIGESLQEVLDGDSGYDESQGFIYTEVYGETLGPLLTCMERSGNFEIIRLLPANNKTCPDVLIVDRASGRVVLQECKATFCGCDSDYQAVDLCERLRDRKRDGVSQLVWPDPTCFTGRRMTIRPELPDVANLLSCSEKSVVVTAIPDGQIVNRMVQSPGREACPSPCTARCLSPDGVGLVTALFSEPVAEPGGALGAELQRLLDVYRATERAVWATAYGCFTRLFVDLIITLAGLVGVGDETSESGGTLWNSGSVLNLLSGPLATAVDRGIYADFDKIRRVCRETLRGPLLHGMMDLIGYLADRQGESEPPPCQDITLEELHTLAHGGSGDSSHGLLAHNWHVTSKGRPGSPDAPAVSLEVHAHAARDNRIEFSVVPDDLAPGIANHEIGWALTGIAVGDDEDRRRVLLDAFEPQHAYYVSPNGQVGPGFYLGHSLSHKDHLRCLVPDEPVMTALKESSDLFRTMLARIDQAQEAGENVSGDIAFLQSLKKSMELMVEALRESRTGHALEFGRDGVMALVASDQRALLRLPRKG